MKTKNEFKNRLWLQIKNLLAVQTGVLLLVLATAHVRAATNIVTTLADSGSGSLRQTIINSAPGNTITFAVNGSNLFAAGS